jgi:DNA-binding CsgD family transcriptional regulator
MIAEGVALAGELGMRPLVERLQAIVTATEQSVRLKNPHGLTHREIEILRELAGGMTNREIGNRLFISEKTVAAHVGNIYRKAGLSQRPLEGRSNRASTAGRGFWAPHFACRIARG